MEQHLLTKIAQLVQTIQITQQQQNPGGQAYESTNLTLDQRNVLEVVNSTAILAAQVRLSEQIVKNAFEQGWTQGLREQQTTGLFTNSPQFAGR